MVYFKRAEFWHRTGFVWANSGYGSHYAIRDNAVIWLDRIDPGRHSEYADVEQARLLGSTPSRLTARTRMA